MIYRCVKTVVHTWKSFPVYVEACSLEEARTKGEKQEFISVSPPSFDTSMRVSEVVFPNLEIKRITPGGE